MRGEMREGIKIERRDKMRRSEGDGKEKRGEGKEKRNAGREEKKRG